MFASKNERKVHYSIRKFSIGVASVAVASLFMGSVVHATEKEVTTQVATSSNKANKSQTEHMKAAKQVDEYIEKMLSEIQLIEENVPKMSAYSQSWAQLKRSICVD